MTEDTNEGLFLETPETTLSTLKDLTALFSSNNYCKKYSNRRLYADDVVVSLVIDSGKAIYCIEELIAYESNSPLETLNFKSAVEFLAREAKSIAKQE